MMMDAIIVSSVEGTETNCCCTNLKEMKFCNVSLLFVLFYEG